MAGAIGEEFSAVASKFYRSEAERLRKHVQLAHEVGPFHEAVKPMVEDLHMRDIKFCVFDMVPGADPPRIHVGMVACCQGHGRIKPEVTDEMRREVADVIRCRTKFKEVRWEI